MSNNIVFKLSPIINTEGFSGRANLSACDGSLTAKYKGGNDSYVLRFELPEKLMAAGVTARIKLAGWESISYAAIGYSKLTGYKHIKAKNIRQNAWVDFGFTHQDIIWQLQNGSGSTSDTEIKDVRVFIKGKPSADGAVLEVAGLSLLGEPETVDLPDTRLLPDSLLDVLYGYLQRSFRDYSHNASEFMQTGKCPMPGKQLLDWEAGEAKPEGLESVSTYRFSWHGLHPAINLLLHARETGEIGPVFAAKTFIDNWLEQSFYTPDQDSKFAWYDHGAAERLLALIIMWSKGVELKLDRRFMQRLAVVIVKHARLLNSEAFYAYHQPLRYHNHAWFQDAALIATAIAFAEHEEANGWLENAISRFEDQLDNLIVRDGGFAIFVENSIGYHHGVQRLAEFVGELVALSGKKTEIPTIAQELVAWSDFLRYPDGRVPAQGDTFRLPPRTGKDVRRGEPWVNPTCTVLPKAGYAVVKGNHDGKPWMLCLFNTSLSDTHKHEDNLSITFWFDGVEWLIDPSFYSHEYDQEIPKYLRSAAAHNKLYFPGKESKTNPKSAFICSAGKGTEFNIRAGYTCDDGVVSTRMISGDLGRIDIRFRDELAQYDSGGPAILSLNLQEDVTVESIASEVNMASSSSLYSISLTFDEVPRFDRSAVGLGFMKSEITSRIVVEHPCSRKASWSMEARVSKVKDIKAPELNGNEDSILAGKKIGIIGSCVTRDVLQGMKVEGINYFARTGFVSLFSEAVCLNEDCLVVKGAFEKRMILSDFDKRAIQEFRGSKVDVLFLDFIDERFDLLRVSGAYVTFSNYLSQSGALGNIGEYDVIPREDAHGLWFAACMEMVEYIKQLGCPVVLHKAWWAEKYMNHDTGRVESFSDKERAVARLNNNYLSDYYGFIEEALPELIVVECEEDLIYSDFAHKWGKDFFHYSGLYYERVREHVISKLNLKFKSRVL